MDAEELDEGGATRFHGDGRGNAQVAVDEDPFVRLTEADFARLRQDPSELAEELRFGSFWLAHSPAAGGRAQGRALEVAAEVIEALPLARREADDAQREAAKAIRLADAALKATKQAAAAAQAKAAQANAAPPPQLVDADDPVALIRAHLQAYVDYVSRLERYIDDLRDLLVAHGGADAVVANPAEGEGDAREHHPSGIAETSEATSRADERSIAAAPLHLVVDATMPAGGTNDR